MWVHFFHGGGNGAAAADGPAQIVPRVFIGRVADGIELFQDSVHPIGKPTVLHPGPRGKGSNAGHEIPLTSVLPPWDDGLFLMIGQPPRSSLYPGTPIFC